jgi:hypothetical protein
MITKKDIILDYKANTSGKRALKIDFLKGISKSNIYISKKTGLIFHKPKISTDKVLKFWSEKIFSNKIDYKNLTYSSENITMKSRHFYCANFSKKYLIKKNLNFCDFGTGEGNFLKEVLSINKNININFTEYSKKNILLILKDLKSKKLRNYNFHNGPIEHVDRNKNIKNINFGSLLWTLCNCIDPIEVLKSIHKKMSKSSHLLIAESSRILVPFKKPIYNYFNIYNHTENTHPWHFSFNSLSNLLELSGFRIVHHNRFYDENDMVVIAKKRNLNSKPKFIKDDYKKIKLFLKKWKENSFFLKNKKF